ncbi:MAG: PHP-associated domain-containing protein [Anaerovoracaceae bacterium]
MKLDFHTHGKLAKKLPFSTRYTDWLFDEAREAGLDGLCLTEHFNTLQFDELYGYLLDNCRREGDTLLLENGLRIFPGMETDIAEGGHILSLGPAEVILELNRRLEPHKTAGNFLPFEQLMDLFDQYDVLVGGAHPYRQGGHIPELPQDQLARLDFLDLNGKDVAQDRKRCEKLTYGLAERIEKPVISGSDTHQAVQYGCIYTEFREEIFTLKRLGEQISSGAYRIVVSDHAQFQVKTACLLKRALKQIHALGGDYVDILLGGQKQEEIPVRVGA